MKFVELKPLWLYNLKLGRVYNHKQSQKWQCGHSHMSYQIPEYSHLAEGMLNEASLCCNDTANVMLWCLVLLACLLILWRLAFRVLIKNRNNNFNHDEVGFYDV